jgi:zinc and cadmium transporter
MVLTSTFWAVLLTSFLACAVTTTGIIVIRRYERWGMNNTAYFMSFAAGVLISVSFIHIIPKAFVMNLLAPFSLLAGFLAFHLFNRFLQAYVCQAYECENLSLGIIPMVGVGLHSLLDGVIYSVTFNVSILTGALAAIGMVLHEFPEGIVTFLLLERSGFNKKKSAWFAFLAAAISTPLGTLVSFPFIKGVDVPTLGILLAFAAGALVYVGASHLLPAVERENKRYTLLSMTVGILVAILIVVSKG